MHRWETEVHYERPGWNRDFRPGKSGRPQDPTVAAALATPVGSPALRERQARQESLSALAQRWIDALPPEVRPRELPKSYARVANRIALCWPDKALCAVLFDSLLVDKRGGRRGFPSQIKAELVSLRQSRSDRASGR